MFLFDIAVCVANQYGLGKQLLVSAQLALHVNPFDARQIAPRVVGVALASNASFLDQGFFLGGEVANYLRQAGRAIFIGPTMGADCVGHACSAADRFELAALDEALGIEK